MAAADCWLASWLLAAFDELCAPESDELLAELLDEEASDEADEDGSDEDELDEEELELDELELDELELELDELLDDADMSLTELDELDAPDADGAPAVPDVPEVLPEEASAETVLAGSPPRMKLLIGLSSPPATAKPTPPAANAATSTPAAIAPVCFFFLGAP